MNPQTDPTIQPVPIARLTPGLVLAYLLLGAAGLLLGAPSPVFPPAGLSLTVALWFGRRAIPGVWLGAAALNLSLNWMGEHWLGDSFDLKLLAVTAAISTGATLQALIGARLVQRREGNGWRDMAEEVAVIRFLLHGGVLAGVVSASFGATALLAAGRIGRGDMFFTWWTWYVGDVIGILVFAPLVLLLLNRRDPLWRDRQRLILAPMLMTLGLAIVAFHGASRWERQEQLRQLQQTGEAVARDIANRLNIHREVLSSLGHFIEVTPNPSPEQFERFTRSTLRDNPDLFALSLNDWIKDRERPAFEARMSRISPLGAYRITERDDRQRLVRAAARAEYAPVSMIVPLEPNRTVLGFDIYSEPVRRAAVDEAIASSRMAMTDPIQLVQDTLQKNGLLEILPVYGAMATDGADRPPPSGFAVAMVKIEDMLRIATEGKIPEGLVVGLNPPRNPGGEPEWYRIGARSDDSGPAKGRLSWQTWLRMDGREWALSVLSTDSYLRRHRSWVAWAVGIFGLLFAALLQIHMLGMTGGAAIIQRKNRALEAAESGLRELNANLEQKVAERTRELEAARHREQESEAQLRTLINGMPIALAVNTLGGDAKITFINEQLVATFGYTLADIPTLADWSVRAYPDENYRREVFEQWNSALLRAIEEQGRVESMEFRVTCKNGAVRDVLFNAVVLDDRLVIPLTDISELRRVEGELRSARETLEKTAFDITENIPVGTYTMVLRPGETTAHYSFMSRRFLELTGLDREEVAADLFKGFACIHPDDHEAWVELHAEVFTKKIPFCGQTRVIVGGEIRWITSEAIPRTLSDGSTVWEGVLTDVTERVLARQRLEASERNLRHILDNLPTPMVVGRMTAEAPILLMNRMFTATFGYTIEDVPTAHEWANKSCPDSSYRAEQCGLWEGKLQRAVAARELTDPMEWRVVCKDGTRRDVVVTALPLDGIVVTAILDITERKQREERLRRILDNVPVPIAIYDIGKEQSVTFLNAAFIRAYGYTLKDIPTLSRWAERAYPDEEYRRAVFDQWEAAVTRSLRGGTPVEPKELSVLRKDGDRRDVIISAVPQEDMMVTALLDITERKRAEEELVEAKQRAERLERAKSEFLANMSHEIRTPMNAVLGLAQVLEREPLTDHQRDMIRRIRDAGQSLLGIINDVLDFSKIEAGQLAIDLRPFDLAILLKRLESLFGQAAQAKGVRLRLAAPPEPPGSLIGDELRLEQVLINLIGNAIKFTERGEVTLDVTVIEADAASLRLCFTVRDTGIGIARTVKDRLFTPFTQAEAGTTRRYGGTGLGLSISKRLVELMGGEIGVESRPGLGSTFWFELPFARAAEIAPEPGAPAQARPGGKRLAGVHCLVVDDSGMNRDLVGRALALEGATATQAADGQQAVDLLRTRPGDFDAVLMDVRMPVMDGLTATRMIRGELGLADLPVIALTAGVLNTELEAARGAGVSHVLAKPLDLEQLTLSLLDWLKPRFQTAVDPIRYPGEGEEQVEAIAAAATEAWPVADREFPDIAGIDRERAAHALMGNRALFLRLLAAFVEEFADVAAATRADLAGSDAEGATRRLHTLRGNAGTLGAMGIMETAKGLEAAIREGKPPLDPKLDDLAGQMADLVAASAPWRADSNMVRDARSVAVPAPDPQALAALREKLGNHDLSALGHFAKLEPTLGGALDEASGRTLSRAIQGLRFEEALGILAEHFPEIDPEENGGLS